jgi:hypothetical protein
MPLGQKPHRLLLLQLLFCSIVQDVPTLEMALDQNLASVFAYRAVHSVTLCPVETMLPRHRILFQIPSGGGGGIRTPVQDTFLFASYSNNLYYIFNLDRSQWGICTHLTFSCHLQCCAQQLPLPKLKHLKLYL